MKGKIFAVSVFCVWATLQFGGCSAIGSMVGVSYQLSGPGTMFLGPPTTIEVGNLTPYYFKLFALDECVGKMAPGDKVHDEYALELQRNELPLAAVAYSDSFFTTPVGVAWRKLGVEQGRASRWDINPGELFFLDGRGQYWGSEYAAIHPLQKPGKIVKVDFPRICYTSKTVVQVINLSNFSAESMVHYSSRDAVPMKSAEVRVVYEETNHRNDTSRDGEYRFRFVDQGFLRGYSEPFGFTVGPALGGPYVYQMALYPPRATN